MRLHVHPLSPTDGYAFLPYLRPQDVGPETEAAIRDAVAALYEPALGLQPGHIALPVSARLPLVGGGTRIGYRIRVGEPRGPSVPRAERRRLRREAARA